MTSTEPIMPRPLPASDRDTAPYWEAMNERKLIFQKCASCATVRYPVGPLCPQCHSFEAQWITSSGIGTVFSFTIVRHQTHPAFPVPYQIVLVEMQEGPRVVARVDSLDGVTAEIGTIVSVEFEDAGGQLLPVFHPSGDPVRGGISTRRQST